MNNCRCTPLHSASAAGHIEVLKLLLEKGAYLMVVDNYGWTPLYSASLKEHFEVVRLLLEGRVNAEVEDANGRTALCFADAGGHMEVVQLLLSPLWVNNTFYSYKKRALEGCCVFAWR